MEPFLSNLNWWHVLVFLGLSAMTVSKFGVKLAQLMSTRALKLGFEMFLLAVALKLFFA